MISPDYGKNCNVERQVVLSRFPMMRPEIKSLDERLELVQDTQAQHSIHWGTEVYRHLFTLTRHTDEAEVARKY